MTTCNLCPTACHLGEGEVGSCRVRIGAASAAFGTSLLTYGHVSTALVGPIEQKPFFHFMPGANVLSIGSNGCNMFCGYCQNFEISQVGKKAGEGFSPRDVVDMAISKGASGIAFTYSEPLVWYEYVRDVAKEARKAKLATILKTNGLCSMSAFAEMSELMDAINIDVKGGERSYREVCGVGSRDVVLVNLFEATKRSHVEVSVILIPGYEDELEQTFDDISTAVLTKAPVHLLRFVPDFKMRAVPPTSFEAMDKAKELAHKFFRHVYLGYSAADNETKCSCGATLVSRKGLGVAVKVKDNYCPECGERHTIILGCDTTSAVASVT